MALSANRMVDVQNLHLVATADLNRLAVKDNETLYSGALVGADATGVFPVDADSGCVGIVLEHWDAGTIPQVFYALSVWLPFSGGTADAEDVGKTCYAVDDESVQLSSSSASRVGVIRGYRKGGTEVLVEIG